MLVVDGGSITYGADLQDKTQAWPYMVNKNVINLALKGKSSPRVEIDVQSYYYNVQKFDQCIIAWPNITRNFVYLADKREYVDFNALGMHNVYQDKKFLESYYTKYFCPVENLRVHWLRCLRLIAWFQQENITWMMLNQDCINQNIYNVEKSEFTWFNNTSDQQIEQMFIELQILEQEIKDKKNYKGFDNYYIADSHPNADEHLVIGKQIKEMWDEIC